jgi:hypothetical protein
VVDGPARRRFGRFAVADSFMRSSEHPAVWVAAAWGILPLLLADAVVTRAAPRAPR